MVELLAETPRFHPVMPILQAVLLLVFPALVITAALRDVTSYIIPNWISVALVIGFFPAALALGLPWSTIGLSVGVGVVALVAGIVMFALNWMGGGDAKLFAAAGLWLGWTAVLDFLLLTAVAGGVLTLALLLMRSARFQPYVPTGPAWLWRLAQTGESVPYGAAIAVGALVASPGSALMKAFQGV
jgi:prepilin peptidase CpaA